MAVYTQTNTTLTGYSGASSFDDTTRTLSAPSGPTGPSVSPNNSWTDTTRTLSAPTDSVGPMWIEADGDHTDTRRTLSSPNDNLVPGYYEPTGVIIPTGKFRAVTVTIEDSEGKPLRDAELVQSAGLFPTASRVKEKANGEMKARLWLLHAAYEEFNVIASGGEDYGLVWSQKTGHDSPAVDAEQREATLQFNEEIPGPGGSGISVSEGAGLGN